MAKKTKHESFVDSVIQYLIESLDNYKAEKYDFAILHAVIALELLLKEKLRIINPYLIYENIDKTDVKPKWTIGLNKLPGRLINLVSI